MTYRTGLPLVLRGRSLEQSLVNQLRVDRGPLSLKLQLETRPRCHYPCNTILISNDIKHETGSFIVSTLIYIYIEVGNVSRLGYVGVLTLPLYHEITYTYTA